ncbi:MAG: zinc ABC transporter substrate-binding protein [Deltaproteobacteria bacterium]|nr:zinc ABC transporter substrate-binding protein [Deltaproteobacteria bacterium]
MRLALCQASRVRDALVELAPASENAIQARFRALERDLTQLDTRLRGAAKAWGDQPMLASHPVYQYLADGYDLRIESVHFEPDEALGPEAIQGLARRPASRPTHALGSATAAANPAAAPRPGDHSRRVRPRRATSQ